MTRSLTAAMVLFLLALSGCAPGGRETITVHVTASMTDAVRQIAEAFTGQTGIEVQLNIASSGTLARQIAAGAPADVFISANTQWMNYVTNEHGLILGSRVRIASNRIVVIVSSQATEWPKDILDLPEFAGSGIAVGDPTHVPAGMYAKTALQRAGVWEEIQGHIIPALDVRAALAYVERGETGLGIVYASDVLQSENVRVAFVIPWEYHPPIIYEAGIPAGANDTAARSFIEFLTGPVGQAAFERFGFTPATEEQ